MSLLLPKVALLVGLLLGAVGFLFEFYRQHSGGVQSLLSRLCLLGTIVSMSLAAGGPERELQFPAGSTTALIDVSASVSGSLGEKWLEHLRKYESKDRPVLLVPFAEKVGVAPIPLANVPSFDALRRSSDSLNTAASHIERALDAAHSTLGVPSAILASDGFESAGNAVASLVNQNQGLQVYPLILDDPTDKRLEASQIIAPILAPAGESFTAKASFRNDSQAPLTGTVQFFLGGKEISSTSATIAPGSEDTFSAPGIVPEKGSAEIRAVFTEGSSVLAESRAYVTPEARSGLLLVNGATEDERLLKPILLQLGYNVTSITPTLGTSLPEILEFSSVVFNNVALTQLSAATPGLIQKYVSAGGGFVMVGGSRSFGLGGYRGSVIADILPVEPLPPKPEQKRFNAAVMLVIDKSRSMASDQRIDFAREAAKETVRNLKDEDYIGIIAFDAAPFIAQEIGRLSAIRNLVLTRIDRIFPAGSTNLFPAMDEARRALSEVPAGRKHMIVLTDGKLPDSGPHYAVFARQIRMLGITVSTVLLGGGGDDGTLQSIADGGGGAFYETDDPRNLPRIFLQDVKKSTGEQTLREEQEYPVRVGSEVVSTTLRSFPPLLGFVATKAKERATTELSIVSRDGNSPLLASWAVGSGRSVAFTSDANGRWSRDWASWPRFQTFWTDIIESVKRKHGTKEKLSFDLKYGIARGALQLSATVFSEKAPSLIVATITSPQGTVTTLQLPQSAPGFGVGELPVSIAGKYEVVLSADGTAGTPISLFVPGDALGEQRGRGVYRTLLEVLAQQSGGRINPGLEDLASVSSMKVESESLSPYFAALTLLFFVGWVVFRQRSQNDSISEKREKFGVEL